MNARMGQSYHEKGLVCHVRKGARLGEDADEEEQAWVSQEVMWAMLDEEEVGLMREVLAE